MKISAVTFVYNEEAFIGDCLKSLKPYVDEILIAEMSSTDRTMEVAYEHTRDIYRVPHLICGDYYKNFLAYTAKGDWLLWFYPDERFNEKFLNEMRKLCDSDKFDAYAVMRHEYRDGIRLMPYGTNSDPNFQNRLHRKDRGIFYTELVHAELHGRYETCALPNEYWMEHRKNVSDQEFDNFRLYAEYKHLLWKYRDAKVEPYKTFLASYRQIIRESEQKNESGERMVHPAEEHWWHWWDHVHEVRIPQADWNNSVKVCEAAHAKA